MHVRKRFNAFVRSRFLHGSPPGVGLHACPQQCVAIRGNYREQPLPSAFRSAFRGTQGNADDIAIDMCFFVALQQIPLTIQVWVLTSAVY